MLAPGRRGLGFAVGREHLPAFFAALGVAVVATDLDGRDDTRAREWVDTDQHAAARRGRCSSPRLADRARTSTRLVTFAPPT